MSSYLKYDGQIPINNIIQRLKIISINPSIILMLHLQVIYSFQFINFVILGHHLSCLSLRT